MQIKVRYKDFPEREMQGIATKPWLAQTDSGEKQRFYLILPIVLGEDGYCGVHVVLEEIEEWKALSGNGEYSNQLLLAGEFIEVDKSLEEDLYYVWEDGEKEHPERAKRIYRALEDKLTDSSIS